MKQNISIGPHVEGVIRIAVNHKGDSENNSVLGYSQSMEVHSREHDAEVGAGGLPRNRAHQITDKLLEMPANQEAGKIKEIPIKVFFNRTENALDARFQAYAKGTMFPVCSGDGVTAVRNETGEFSADASKQVACNGPEFCDFAMSGAASCRRQVKLTVQIDLQDDPLSVFQVRTSSYHSYQALAGQLALIEKRFHGLRHVPLKLCLWQASTRASGYENFDLFRIALNAPNETEAMKQAKAARAAEQEAGLYSDLDEIYAVQSTDKAVNRATDDLELSETFFIERDSPTRTKPGALMGASQKPAVEGPNQAQSFIAESLAVALAKTSTAEVNKEN